MYRDSHFTAIVLAAGSGSRMQSDIPKQYMLLSGKEVLYYSLNAFENSAVDDIILVTRNEDIEYCRKDIIEKYHINKVRKIIEGGSERYWSVRNGLNAATDTDYVLIHDGARPCIDCGMIHRLMDEVLESGASTVGVPAKDTIKVVDDANYGVSTPDRKTLWQIQTPQGFDYKDIISAYNKMEKDNNCRVTDDTMIIEQYFGKKSKVIMGDYRNIKITTPEDIFIAEIFLNKS